LHRIIQEVKEILVFSILSITMGLIIFVIGVIIRRYKVVELLSVYNPKKVVDKDGLANWAGSKLILTGVMVVLIGIFAYVLPVSNDTFYIVALIIVSIIMTVWTSIGYRRYEIK